MSPDVTRKGRPGKPGPAAPRSRAANAARRFVVAILFGCLIAGLIPFAGFTLQPAQAASSLTAAQKEFKQAKAELAAIQAQLDRLAQKQEDAEVRLSKTLDSIDKVQTKTEKAKKDLAVSQAKFEDRLVDIYKNRGTQALGALNTILSGDDMSLGAVLDRLTMVTHLAEQDSQLVSQISDKLDELDQLAAELADKKAAQQNDAAEYEAARDETLTALEASKDQYNTLRARVARLQAEEKKRQEEAAKLAAAQAAARQALTVNQRTLDTPTAYRWPGLSPSGLACRHAVAVGAAPRPS